VDKKFLRRVNLTMVNSIV